MAIVGFLVVIITRSDLIATRSTHSTRVSTRWLGIELSLRPMFAPASKVQFPDLVGWVLA